MKKRIVAFIAAVIAFMSCDSNSPEGFTLPNECDNKCELVHDMNSFYDATLNATAQFSKCLCVNKGLLKGDIVISKSLIIIGRDDKTSELNSISFYNAKNVYISNIYFRNMAVNDSAMFISKSKVTIENVEFFNIRAGSLFGGRAIVVSGGKSDVILKNIKITNTDGTGLLINGEHDIEVDNSVFSDCGFAGIWIQNNNEKTGRIKLNNTILKDNGAVSLQILGLSTLEINDSVINGIEEREINMKMVGDGIVVKNNIMTKSGSVIIKNVEIKNFKRAGIIFDGVSGEILDGIEINNLSLKSSSADFGVVVQNGIESEEFREMIVENPFAENDLSLSNPLYIVEIKQEI